MCPITNRSQQPIQDLTTTPQIRPGKPYNAAPGELSDSYIAKDAVARVVNLVERPCWTALTEIMPSSNGSSKLPEDYSSLI